METQSLEMVPIHLTGYPVFQKLQEWKLDQSSRSLAEKRSWIVNSYDYCYIRCTLNWRFGDGQMGGIIYTSFSAEESVWMAMKRFAEWAEEYYKLKT